VAQAVGIVGVVPVNVGFSSAGIEAAQPAQTGYPDHAVPVLERKPHFVAGDAVGVAGIMAEKGELLRIRVEAQQAVTPGAEPQ
jgi:hypothetical protein